MCPNFDGMWKTITLTMNQDSVDAALVGNILACELDLSAWERVSVGGSPQH